MQVINRPRQTVDDTDIRSPVIGHITSQQRYDLRIGLDTDNLRTRPARRHRKRERTDICPYVHENPVGIQMMKDRPEGVGLVYPECEQGNGNGFLKTGQAQRFAVTIWDYRRFTLGKGSQRRARQPGLAAKSVGNSAHGASGKIERKTAFIHARERS